MRRPIEIERRGLQMPRERLWAALRELRTGFTVLQVQDTARPLVPFRTAKDYLRELEVNGYLRRVSGGDRIPGAGARCTPVVFDLADEAPHEPPTLPSSGTSTKGMGTLAMWRCMKVLSHGFSLDELVSAASIPGVISVSRATARDYILALMHAGYLVSHSPPRSGKVNRWRLVRNTGSHAPAVTRRKGVFDRNTGEFAELETAQEVCDGLE